MSVPRLRFPEFKDDGEWGKSSIGSKVDILSGYPFDGDDILQDICEQKLLRGINITEGEIRHNQEIDRYFNGDTSFLKQYFVAADDIVIGMDGSKVGKNVALVTEKDTGALLVQRVARLRASEKVSSKFIFQLIKSITFQNYVDKVNTSSGIPHISARQINDYTIYIPLIYEQQKIAACLSSLDDLIAAHNQKLTALKTHKKGLLQQLFPTEGESIPRLRFSEFRVKGEWDSIELQNLGTIIRGASPRPQGDPRYFGGSIPRLMGKDVSRDGKWVTPCTDFLTVEGAELSRFCKKGTLTIVCSGDVGVPSFLAIDACIHDGFLALIDIDHNKIIDDFLFYSLSNLQEKFSDSATHGGVFINLTTTILKEFRIALPSPFEQQKIADCLTSLDNQIAAQTQKIEALKTHKKGLMQQLFPQAMDASE